MQRSLQIVVTHDHGFVANPQPLALGLESLFTSRGILILALRLALLEVASHFHIVVVPR